MNIELLTPDSLNSLLSERLLPAIQESIASAVNTALDTRPEANQEQLYATPLQLAKMFGVDKSHMWRQLRSMTEQNKVEVIRCGEESTAYPRYKIADVLANFKANAARS